MKKNLLISFCILIIFSLLGCSMDVSQPPSAIPYDANNVTPTSNLSATVPWAELHLSGRLVYSTVSAEGGVYFSRIKVLDLADGSIKTIYTSEGNGWIYYLTVSPDAKQLIMSYTTPPQPGAESVSNLYVLPLEEGASAQVILAPPTSFDRYIQVEWSSDGNDVYFAYYNQTEQSAGQAFPDYQIFRMAFPGGQPEKITEHAFWPRSSPDSSNFVYITLDPSSGFNKLFVADADGSNPQEVQVSGLPVEIMDAPIFSPDGQSILFSAPVPPQAYQPNWLDRLMGVQSVKAHNIPSDWWSVPISGGEATRLTQIQTIKLFASVSPDGKHIASLSGEGIFVMDPDGSNLTRLLLDPEVSSVVNWIP
jgi:Tol biopolymer transport system component